MIPEQYRTEGLTYEFVFVSSADGAIDLRYIIANTPNDSSFTAENEPEINTGEWVGFVSEHNGSARYEYYEIMNKSLYTVRHDGAVNGCAWENTGDGDLQFLPVLGSVPFDLREYTKYTRTIWYRDTDGGTDDFRSIETKPWSIYRNEATTIYRVPTYRDGMTDLHSDDGRENLYEFIIVFSEDAIGRPVCWCRMLVGVADSYEMYLEEQNN